MMRRFLTASAISLFGVSHAAKPDPSSLRKTNAGEVIGSKGPNQTHVWRGIPYALPPIGDLRWRAPRSRPVFDSVFLATNKPPICTQYNSPLGNTGLLGRKQVIGQEDCLYLSVWAPRFDKHKVPTTEDRLPVMFWIHGGGNSIGYGDAYQPFNLVQQEQVIVVTINYRLGPLGWFPHPAIRATADNPQDASGMYGLLDIIAALRWVQANIESFGGNPDKVTIFGESAGAANVFMLLASPLAKGLFHQAIAQSARAYLYPIWQAEEFHEPDQKGHPNSSSEVISRLYAQQKQVSVSQVHKLVAETPEKLSSFLWHSTPESLLRMYKKTPTGMLFFPAYLRDGYVVPDQPLAQTLADPSLCNKVPLITGTNRDEQKTFLALNQRLVTKRMGLHIRDLDKYNSIAQYFSQAWKFSAVDNIANAYAQHTPVWGYRFDWDNLPRTWFVDFANLLGAGHALEMPFVFGEFQHIPVLPFVYNRKNRVERQKLSSQMMFFWGQFARTGNPNAVGNEDWEKWDESEQVLLFDAPPSGIRMATQTVSADALKKRLFADSTLTKQEKCYVYKGIFRYSDFYDENELVKLACIE